MDPSKFCTSCGAPLNGGTFCSHCGARVAAQSVPKAAPAVAAKSSPLIPLILLGVTALYTFINFFIHTYGFGSFLGKFFAAAPIAGLIVGLLIFTKKEKNLIFAISFFALAFMEMVSSFQMLRYGRVGFAIFSFLFSSVICAANAGIGLTYLFGKAKLAPLKTLCCCAAAGASFMLILVSTIAFHRGFGYNLIGFLFSTLPLYAATILYTPYQK